LGLLESRFFAPCGLGLEFVHGEVGRLIKGFDLVLWVERDPFHPVSANWQSEAQNLKSECSRNGEHCL